jgi:hypothetical protein
LVLILVSLPTAVVVIVLLLPLLFPLTPAGVVSLLLLLLTLSKLIHATLIILLTLLLPLTAAGIISLLLLLLFTSRLGLLLLLLALLLPLLSSLHLLDAALILLLLLLLLDLLLALLLGLPHLFSLSITILTLLLSLLLLLTIVALFATFILTLLPPVASILVATAALGVGLRGYGEQNAACNQPSHSYSLQITGYHVFSPFLLIRLPNSELRLASILSNRRSKDVRSCFTQICGAVGGRLAPNGLGCQHFGIMLLLLFGKLVIDVDKQRTVRDLAADPSGFHS